MCIRDRATPTTTPRYALMKEQLQKETWTPYTCSFANSKCGGGMWVPRSKFFSQFISCLGIGVCPRILLYIKKKRGVAMVAILSSHQQNAMVSTLNVLLLTLNKALPGGRLRIARVSLMVRVKFSLNKFQSTLDLKTSRAIILFPLSRWIHHQVQVQVWGKSLKDHHCHTHSRSPTRCITQHRLHQHDKRQGKDTKFSQPPSGLAESPLP